MKFQGRYLVHVQPCGAYMFCGMQLLWRVDQGQAVQIAGIPDPTLRQQLGELFMAMHLAKASKVS